MSFGVFKTVAFNRSAFVDAGLRLLIVEGAGP
jgi:hypothetical protein